MDMTPKSPEPESETPTRIQPAKPISFSNGIIKRHHIHHHPISITYKECLKNHAAAIGGHALDGCGEFMPSPSSTPSDPTSLKCAACGCHRNFHRRDPDDTSLNSAVPPPSLPPSSTTAAIEYQPHHRHHPPPPVPPLPRSPNSSSPPPISSSYMLLALSGNNKTGGNNLPFSDLNFAANNLSGHHHHTPGSRKRFRTKFSQNQKEKMHEFADRIGWKIQKRDEDEVRDFCREIGVDKGVLKVWMHNNKNTFTNRRDQPFPGGNTIQSIDNGLAVSGGENNNNNNNSNNNDNNNNNNNADDVGVHAGNGLEHDLHRGGGGRFESDSGGAAANGSSSSS